MSALMLHCFSQFETLERDSSSCRMHVFRVLCQLFLHLWIGIDMQGASDAFKENIVTSLVLSVVFNRIHEWWFCFRGDFVVFLRFNTTTAAAEGASGWRHCEPHPQRQQAGWAAAHPPVSWLRSWRGKWLWGKQGLSFSSRRSIALSRTRRWYIGARPPFLPQRPLLASRIYFIIFFLIGEFPSVNRGRWPTRRSAPSKWCAVLGP